MESSDVATSKQTATVPSTASSTKARSHNGVFRWLTSFWNGLFGSKSPPHNQSLVDKSPVLLQAFILEPMYTPSGLVDGIDDTPDLATMDIDTPELPELGEDWDISDEDSQTFSHGDGDVDLIPEDTADSIAETTPETPLLTDQLEDIPFINPTFESGTFTVGETGDVSIDFLFDGGNYQGELAIFSLDGMDEFEPGSEEFIQEAASRALSDSELGHIAIADQTEGARFSDELAEVNDNAGEYLGVKTFQMRPGDEFGVMLVPNSTVQQVFDNPDAGGAVRPLFSMATANPEDAFHTGQIADVTGDGSTFVMEDLRVDADWNDQDYNDIVFQVRGATGKAALMDDVVDPNHDWRGTDMGEALTTYARPYITPDTPDDGGLLTDELVGESPTDDSPVDESEIVTEPTTEESTDVVIDEPVNNSEIVTEPTTASELAEPVQYEFPQENQPLVGIIDTGFSENNPDIDYSRISLGQDRIDGDNNPLMEAGEGNEHGTHVLGIIGATQDNDIGVEGINDDAPLWVGRAVGSGKWAESLVEFVDAAQESGQPNAVVNLSLDLTQIDADGNVTTRYEFTPMERAAIEYARQNNVMLVVAAGNDGDVMSVLGQASQEFDNILTVGAAEQFDPETSVWKGSDRTDYSSYGHGLDVMAYGGTADNPQLSLTGEGTSGMAGTSVATAKVTGAVSQVWAANPELSYRQVVEIIKNTATDLGSTSHDAETGAGLLNIAAAVHLAKATTAREHSTPAILSPETWSGEGVFTPGERAVQSVIVPPEWRRWYYGWLNDNNPSDTFAFSIDEPTPLQFSLNFMGSAVLRKNGQVVLEGKSDGNMLYAGSDGKLSPGSYVLTVNRGNHSKIDEYRLIMNFLEGSQGQEVPIIDYLPSPTPTQPPDEDSPITDLPELIKKVAEKRAKEAILKAYQTNQGELDNSLEDIQVHWKAFDGMNVPAVHYFDGGYIIWNGVKAITYFTGTGHQLPNIDLPETIYPIWQPTPPVNIIDVPDGRHIYPNMRGSSEYWVDLKGSKNVMHLAARDTVLTHPDLRTTVYRDLGNGRLQQVPLTGVNPDDNYASFQNLRAGTYLIKVDVAQDKANVPYEMIVNLDQAGDSLAKTRNLNREYGKIDGKRIIVSDHVGVPQGDKDLYAFTTSNFQPVLQFAVRSLYSDLNQETKNRLLDGDIKMRLLDSNGNKVLSVDSVNRKPTFAAENLKPNSKYYIEVTARNGSRTNYDLVLNFEQLWAQSGRHEFKGLTGQLEYNFRVDSNATDRTLHTAVRDVNGKIIDSIHYTSKIYRQQNGQWVAVNPNSTGNSVFRYDSLRPGKYRVVMTPKPSMPSSSYTFVHNLDQAGQTRSDARNLGQIGGKRVTVNDHVGVPTGELDYYKFSTGSDPRLLQFAVRHPSGSGSLPLEGDVELILYDKNGKELKKVNSRNRKSTYDEYELKANSEYYVRVKAQSGDSGNYHLVLNAEVKRNTGGTNPNPNYIYTNADYLNALYQDNINNRLGSNSHNHDHIIREAVDSIDGDSNPGIYALVGGEVIEAKNGKEVSSKYWGYNGTVAIYNKELNQTFIYWHLAEGSINENLQGKTIAAGSLIGKEGNTGASYGSHTHVEVHNNRAYVNMSNPLNPQSPANSGRLHVPTVFQNAVRKGLVKLYK
ncbi:S8 family serine peptidase [Coleofasciculus sp.]|uniref:S8 family serine peptidase n=1 Tax=Coleofasciculus sp. TaxID=3100458 RepID=UPI0039FB6560